MNAPTPEADAYIGDQNEVLMTEGVGTIRAMREAIKEAHKALGMCAGVIGAPLDTEWKSVEECDASHNAAIAALAKLQPFLK